MADRYARSTGGNWSSSGTWELTPGGGEVTTAPSSTTDVYLVAGSGPVTVDTTSCVCAALSLSGYNDTFTITNGCRLSVYQELDLTSGESCSLAGSGTLRFYVGSASARDATFAGKTIPWDINFYKDKRNFTDDLILSGSLIIDTAGASYIYGAPTVYIGGDFTCGSLLSFSSYNSTIVLNGTGTWSSDSSNDSTNAKIIINTSGTITLGSTVYYTGNLIQYVSGTVVTTGSTLYLRRGGDGLSLDLNGVILNNVNFTKEFNSPTITLLSDLTIRGDIVFPISASDEVTFAGDDYYVILDDDISIINGGFFTNLRITKDHSVEVEDGVTITILGSLDIEDGVNISSDTPGSAFTLSKSSGVAIIDGATIDDVTFSGGASWYVGESVCSGCAGMTRGLPNTSISFWPPVTSFGQYLEVSFLKSDDPNIEIHYTTDGSEPTFSSDTYTGPFTITGTTIRARAYDVNGIALGDIYHHVYIADPLHDPSGFKYEEYYLYSEKRWEMAPSGVSYYTLASGVMNNSPIVATSSGYEVGLNDPWAKCSGKGKYTKVGYGHFTTLDDGSFDEDCDEFCLHPDSSGKILFNKILDENVFIEYEGGSDSYYTMTGVDYNPIRNETTGGFVHFSIPGEPVDLSLTVSEGAILADGYRGCTLTATLYDSNYDRVSARNIIFELEEILPGLTEVSGVYSGVWSELGRIVPTNGTVITNDASGHAIALRETTNVRGEAYIDYITNDKKTGIARFKAYYESASGVYDRAALAQYWVSSGPFILDISLLDMLDYLTADVYVYGG